MEGRMFRFRARVASLFAVRLNAQSALRHALYAVHPWLKDFASLREKQKSRPDCRNGFDFIR